MLAKLRRLFCAASPVHAEAIDFSVAANAPLAARHIGDRRQTNFWEPIYGPEVTVSSEPHNWDFEADPSPTRRFMSGETLVQKIHAGETHKVKGVTFRGSEAIAQLAPKTSSRRYGGGGNLDSV